MLSGESRSQRARSSPGNMTFSKLSCGFNVPLTSLEFRSSSSGLLVKMMSFKGILVITSVFIWEQQVAVPFLTTRRLSRSANVVGNPASFRYLLCLRET